MEGRKVRRVDRETRVQSGLHVGDEMRQSG
ncbi:uncharacterized protein G2W53_024241 [Senna tora]|uniref:Uncharacterized protein n=1 Tax=Senna tora TaxID=362788 RepID=A0A834TCJ9_9FABA|nr:uncharacterized protein G2W53_024241 [Senna tora]